MNGHGLPAFIDPQRLAAGNRTLSGSVATRNMSRLHEAVLTADEQVRVALWFAPHGECRGEIGGTVELTVRLQCQRCLHPVAVRLAPEVRLGLVQSEDQADQLPAELEPMLVHDDQCRLQDLVEDELLLALPLVPMHSADSPDCIQMESGARPEVEAGSAGHDRKQPFHELAALKKKQ